MYVHQVYVTRSVLLKKKQKRVVLGAVVDLGDGIASLCDITKRPILFPSGEFFRTEIFSKMCSEKKESSTFPSTGGKFALDTLNPAR